MIWRMLKLPFSSAPLLFFTLCILLQSYLSTADCEPIQKGNFDIFPPEFPSVCAKIIDYDVYIESSLCQTELEGRISSLNYIFGLGISQQCEMALLETLCVVTYPKCRDDGTHTEIGCRSVCQKISTACVNDTLYLAALGSLFPEVQERIQCASNIYWSDDTDICTPEIEKTVTYDMVPVAKCETYEGEFCKNSIASSSVYIPAGLEQTNLESTLDNFRFVLALAPIENDGARLLQAMMCDQVFYPCHKGKILGTVDVNLPQLPCKSLCEKYKEVNADFIASDASLAALDFDCDASTFGQSLDCKGNVVKAGSPNYPDGSYTMYQVSMQCHTHSSEEEPDVIASAVHQVNAVCDYPLVFPDEPESTRIMRVNGGTCAVACPIPLFSKEELKSGDVLLITLAVPSTLACLLLILTFSLFKVNRNRYVLFMAICLLVLFLILIANRIRASALGYETIAHSFCRNNAEEYQFDNGPYCLFNGIVFIYAILAAMDWWLVQATDIFLKVVLGFNPPLGSKEYLIREYWYQAFAWLAPLIFLLPMIIRKQIGGLSGGTPWCFYTLGRNAPKGIPDNSLYIFFIPLACFTVVGCCMIIIVLINLILMHIRSQQATKSGSLFQVYFRLLIFVFFLSYLWLFFFSYKLYVTGKSKEWTSSMEDMIRCHLIDKHLDPTITCPTVPEKRMNTGLAYSIIVLVSLSGFILSAISLFSIEIFKSWANFFFNHFPRACKCMKRYTAESSSQDYFNSKSGNFNSTSNYHTQQTSQNQSTQQTRKKGLFAKSYANTAVMKSPRQDNGSYNSQMTQSYTASTIEMQQTHYIESSRVSRASSGMFEHQEIEGVMATHYEEEGEEEYETDYFVDEPYDTDRLSLPVSGNSPFASSQTDPTDPSQDGQQ